MPTRTNWRLGVLVKAAHHLPKMDIMGKCDPYAELHLGGQGLKHKTKTVSNSYDAEWNEEFVFTVCGDTKADETNNEAHALHVHIMDHDRYTEDDYIGSVIVNLRDLWDPALPGDQREPLTKSYPVHNSKLADEPAVSGDDMQPTTITLVFSYQGHGTSPLSTNRLIL